MIKTYTPNDFETCCDLLIQVFNGSPWYDKWTADSASKYLYELSDNNYFLGFTAWDNEHLVGATFAHIRSFYSGTEIFVDELFISSDYQNKGFGSELMNALEQYAKGHSISSIILLTDVRKASYGFYKKFGYKHVKPIAFMARKIN